jgi:hypothetical protein
VLRAGEAGGPVADSDDRVGTIDVPVLEWERWGQCSLMVGKGRAAPQLHLLHDARGGRWFSERRSSAWRQW